MRIPACGALLLLAFPALAQDNDLEAATQELTADTDAVASADDEDAVAEDDDEDADDEDADDDDGDDDDDADGDDDDGDDDDGDDDEGDDDDGDDGDGKAKADAAKPDAAPKADAKPKAAPAAKAAASPKSAVSDDEGEGDLGVVEFQLAKGVEDRQPVSPGTSFSSGDQVYAWVKLNVASESNVRARWSHGDEVVSIGGPLTVRPSPSWRTWLSTSPGEAGEWKVELLDPDDNVIHSATFQVQ